MEDYDGWRESTRIFVDAARRNRAHIFPEFQSRLAELVEIARAHEAKQDAAKTDAERAKLAQEGWIICAQIWVYRGSAPICRFPEISLHDMREYLDNLCKEIEDDIAHYKVSDPKIAEQERARLVEVHRAQRILKKYPEDLPRF